MFNYCLFSLFIVGTVWYDEHNLPNNCKKIIDTISYWRQSLCEKLLFTPICHPHSSSCVCVSRELLYIICSYSRCKQKFVCQQTSYLIVLTVFDQTIFSCFLSWSLSMLNVIHHCSFWLVIHTCFTMISSCLFSLAFILFDWVWLFIVCSFLFMLASFDTSSWTNNC